MMKRMKTTASRTYRKDSGATDAFAGFICFAASGGWVEVARFALNPLSLEK
jgi:hypothetical protein